MWCDILEFRKLTMDISEKLKPATVLKKTGKSIEHWYATIEKFGKNKGHTAIAKHLKTKHQLSDWWAQSLTTRYEFEHDLRKRYERSGKNGLTIVVQKTINASIGVVFKAFTESKQLKKWLSPYLKMTVKPGAKFNFDEVVSGQFLTVKPNKQLQLDLYSKVNKEKSHVVIDFVKKENKKTLVKVTQADLYTEIAVNAQKDFWRSCLESAKKYVE